MNSLLLLDANEFVARITALEELYQRQQDQINALSNEPLTPPQLPISPTTPQDTVFYDDFNYIASRHSTGYTAVNNPFVNHGWARCKSTQYGESGARGYLYTTDEIPGHTGVHPSERFLCAEFLGSQGQTDCYLQIGDESGDVNQLPSDIWFNFFIFIDGQIASEKFLYPTQTNYPRPANQMWLCDLRTWSAQPYGHTAELGNAYFQVEHGDSSSHNQASWAGAGEDSWWKLGHTDLAEIQGGRWQEVKMHFDTGIAEIWKRDLDGEFVKTHEWKDGQDVDGQPFSWRLENNDGAKMLRLFTTVNTDVNIYLSNFGIHAGVNSGGTYEMG